MAVSLHDPVEELRDFLFDGGNLNLHGGLCLFRPRFSFVPALAEQFRHQREQLPARYELAQQLFKSALDLGACNRLAEFLTAAMAADVIGIGGVPALGPVRCHGMAAIPAGDKTTQREVRMDIRPRRRNRLAFQALLHLIEGFEADDALMLRLAQADVPDLAFEITGINRIGQDTLDLLIGQKPVTAERKLRIGFEEAFQFRLRSESTAGVAFQPLANDRSERFLTDQDAATAGTALIAIANRRVKHPKTIEHARPHTVFSLLAVFLPLVLRHTREKMLNEDAVGILTKFDGRRFQNAARLGDIGPKFQVGFDPTRQTADIVDDDNHVVLAVLAQEGQHGLHAGPPQQGAGHVILEYAGNIVPPKLRIFPAARFLTFKAVAFASLFFSADAAINNRLLKCFSCHGSESLFERGVLLAPSLSRSTI